MNYNCWDLERCGRYPGFAAIDDKLNGIGIHEWKLITDKRVSF